MKLGENRVMLHIISEVIILVSVIFYFNQKFRKLNGYIEDITERLEEHERIIEDNTRVIKKQNEIIQMMQTIIFKNDNVTPPKRDIKIVSNTAEVGKKQDKKPRLKKNTNNRKSSGFENDTSFENDAIEMKLIHMNSTEYDNSDEQTTFSPKCVDEDLDKEIENELNELTLDLSSDINEKIEQNNYVSDIEDEITLSNCEKLYTLF